MTISDLLMLGVGTWGAAWLLVYGTGPGAMLSKLRKLMGVRYTEQGERYGIRWIGELFNCPVCLSVWIAPALLVMIILGVWQPVAVLAAVGIVEIMTTAGGER